MVATPWKNLQLWKTPVSLIRTRGSSQPFPMSLRGKTYYRTAPGVFDAYGIPVQHPFDADGTLSAFQFGLDGVDIKYRITTIDTQHRQHEQKANRRLYSGAFGTPPKFRALKNAANTSVVHWYHKLLIFYEAGVPYVVDPETLETLGPYAPITAPFACAHPKIDPFKNRLVLFCPSHGFTHTDIQFLEMDAYHRPVINHTVHLPGFVYLHDFLVTPEYYLFFEYPIRFNTLDYAITGNLVKSMQPIANTQTIAHRVHRGTGYHDIITQSPHALPGFPFHHSQIFPMTPIASHRPLQHTNATLCFFSMVYPDMSFPDPSSSPSSLSADPDDTRPRPSYGRLYRSTYHARTGTLHHAPMLDVGWAEFPGLSPFPKSNPKLPPNLILTTGKQHPLETIASIDVETGFTTTFPNVTRTLPASTNGFYMEPVIPAYDPGYTIVTTWNDVENQISYLQILLRDPLTQELSLHSEYRLPEYVPFGLHGCIV